MTIKNSWVIKGIIFSFVILLIFSSCVAADKYSPEIEEFLRNEKEIEFNLYSSPQLNFTFENHFTVTGENIFALTDQTGDQVELEAGTYKLRPLEQENVYWIIQFFASESEETVQQVKEELEEKKLQHVDLHIVMEDGIYRLQSGPLMSEDIVDEIINQELAEKNINFWVREENFTTELDQVGLFKNGDELKLLATNLSFSGPVIIDQKRHPGKFYVEIARGGVVLNNTLNIEKIIKGKLEYRLGGQWLYDNEISHRVGAIIYRSKILNQLENGNYRLQFNDYQGYSGEHEIIEQVVTETRGRVVQKDDKFIDLSPRIYHVLRDVLRDMEPEKALLAVEPELEFRDLTGEIAHEIIYEANIALGLDYSYVEGLNWYGPRAFTVMEADMTLTGLQVKPVLAGNKITSRARLMDMILIEDGLAAVNGGYFDPRGRPLGLMVIEGEIVSTPIYNRTTLVFTQEEEIIIDRVRWEGQINNSIEVSDVNRVPNKNEIIVLNSYFGEKTPAIDHGGRLIIVEDGVVEEVFHGKLDLEEEIPEKGFALLATGDSTQNIYSLLPGTDVEFENHYYSYESGEKLEINSALGAGPRLVRNGETDITGNEESFQPNILWGRAPRSAVGITEDNKLLFITVDGRQPGYSIGVTLAELADLFQELNVVEAMNLDGGDSTGMVIRNFLANNPRLERLLGSGIIIKRD